MDILTYWKNDTNPNKPKILKRGGKYTKKFLNYNRSKIVSGEVNNYIREGYFYNVVSGRDRKIKYDKRYKEKKVITKAFQKKFKLTNNIFRPKIESLSGDSLPSGIDSLKKLLLENDYTGYIRIVFYSDKIIFDKDYKISNINNWWKKNWGDFLIGDSADQQPIWAPQEGDDGAQYFIVKNKQVSKKYINQIFKDGENYYCFFTVILNYLKDKLEKANGKRNKEVLQGKINYITGRQLKNSYKYGLLQKWGGGVPDDKQILSDISNRLNVGFDIEQPFLEEPFLKVRPLKPVKKVFKYINSRLNHLETVEKNNIFNSLALNDEKSKIEVEREELYKIMDNLQKNDECFIFGKDNFGVKNIKTATNYYSVKSDYNEVTKDFENEIGITPNFKIDYYKDKNLFNFIKDATKYNGTIDFFNTDKIDSINDENIKHTDMKKAYSQFYNCKYYSGFVGLITQSIRPMNSYKGFKGCFQIEELFIPNGKLKKLNDKMSIYYSGGIYYDSELKFLENNGCKFKVVYGVIGEKFDFRFNKDMLNKKVIVKTCDKEIPIPYYSKWCGGCDMVNFEKSFFMKGKKEYFENLKTEADIYTTDNKEFKISYEKKSVKSLSHITGQITSYQRLNMMEQLLNMDTDKIIRVVTDGIYYYEHKFNKCEKVIFDFNKDKKNFESWGVWNSFTSNYSTSWKCENKEREYNRVEYHIGGGGSGKTHYNLTDKGLYNVCFVAPSWYLSTEKKKEYNLTSNNVVARFTMENLPYWKELIKIFNNLVIDEASMITQQQKNFIIKNFKGGIYFCGDLGFQLPPPNGLKEMDTEGGKIIKHKNLYRFKCDKLKSLILEVRQYIKNNVDIDIVSLINKFQKIPYEEVKKIYHTKDLIITSENKFINEINKDITGEKYLVLNNTQLYKNGQILFKNPNISGVEVIKTNAFTIHKAQGQTVETKIFIDSRKLKSLKMFYTAISRARYWNQIFFF